MSFAYSRKKGTDIANHGVETGDVLHEGLGLELWSLVYPLSMVVPGISPNSAIAYYK